MANLPRPLIGLLVATVASFAVWTVALKPSSSNGPVSGSSSPSPVASQPKPVTASHAAASHAAASDAAASHTATASSASHASAAKAKPAVKHTVSAQQRQSVIEHGLNRHKVLAVLFYNPAAADDRAVKHELSEIPARGGKVVKLAVPLSELTRYPVITNQLQVTESPTLVLIDGQRRADMLTGFLDQFELSQRVSDALAVK